MTTVARGTVGSGSYLPGDVTFLLTDLSDVPLERPTEDREEASHAGRHYSEDLPVEYEPDATYLALFERALERSAARVALTTGVVGEIIMAEKPRPVLVSLARAGTPAGILLRRWLLSEHSYDAPHYSISIIKDRGIDLNALRWILDRHDASRIQFVDGWTGKGAISKVLAAVAHEHGLDPSLAVLADPGHCSTLFGTRDDYLIPHSCLNSTVSGLVSRTVLNASLIGPGDFHGAKYYRSLADQDVSRRYVDTVAGRFGEVRADVAGSWRSVASGDRSQTWAGWAAVEKIAAEHDVPNVGLVKPGVGETTRVLLRRVPWKVLVEPSRVDELAHVLALCDAKGVAVEESAGMPYSCVGLIRPPAGGADRAWFTSPPVPDRA